MNDISRHIEDLCTTYAPDLNADGAHQVDYTDAMGYRFELWYWPPYEARYEGEDDAPAMVSLLASHGTAGSLNVYAQIGGDAPTQSTNDDTVRELLQAIEAHYLTDGADLIREAADLMPEEEADPLGYGYVDAYYDDLALHAKETP